MSLMGERIGKGKSSFEESVINILSELMQVLLIIKLYGFHHNSKECKTG